MKSFFPKACRLLFIFFLFIPHILHASEPFTVQAGAFSSKNNAQKVVTVLKNRGIQCTINEQKGLYKVYCGEFRNKSEANVLRKKLSSLGYDVFVVPKIALLSQDTPKVDVPLLQSAEAALREETKTKQPPSQTSKKVIPEPEAVQPSPPTPILFNRVVAVVNKEVITWSELYKAMESEAATQIKNLSEEEQKKVLKASEAPFLESYIDVRLQLQEAQKLGLDVTQKEITETIESIKKKYSLKEADFIESLKKEGLGFEEYKKRLSEEILINKVVAYQIRNKIVVSDEAIKKYIEDHKASFSGNDQYKLRQIFFRKPEGNGDTKAIEDKAALMIRRLKAGEDFSALARVYSDDTSGKLGGDLGYVSKDILAKEFIEAISHMNVGDYSMPFWTEKGLHIIKLDEKISAQDINKVKDDVRNKLAEEQFSEKYKGWIKGLREKAYIEVRL